MQTNDDKIVIKAFPPAPPAIVSFEKPPYAKKPIVKYEGTPKNLYDFCSGVLNEANKTFGTLYHLDKKLKNVPFCNLGDEPLPLIFTSEDDMMNLLRNFAYVFKVNKKYYISPKNKKVQPS